MVQITDLRCEFLVEPIGIDEKKPRFSWMMKSDERAKFQRAYRIVVKDGIKTVWDSKKVRSNYSNNIEYDGEELKSFRRYDFTVTVWDEKGAQYSQTSFFETAMLNGEFVSCWLSLPQDNNPVHELSHDKKGRPAAYFRRSINVDKAVKTARIYATALGIYELYLNGARIGDARLCPGWTDYKKHVFYQTYDVTDLLKSGENVVGSVLGDGWYAGNVAIVGRCSYCDPTPHFKAAIRIEYADGTVDFIRDHNWKTNNGPIVYNDLLSGEIYDANLERDGWASAGYDDSQWIPAAVSMKSIGRLKAQIGPLVNKMGEVSPISITKLSDGSFIYDMGQNMVGTIVFNLSANKGTQVKIRYGEMLNDDGTLYTENLRSALQTDIYIAKGAERETYEPRLTFHGFRYVSVEGLDDLSVSDITGIVLYSDLDKTGEFTCSDELVNKLYQNITWGQRGNFVDVPTDCPQRDERMGWSGDTQVFVRTGSFNMFAPAFYERYMFNMVDAQHPDGAFTDVVPYVMQANSFNVLTGYGNTAWGDAGIIVPWTLYLTYRDTRVLSQNYEAMERHIAFMKQNCDGYVRFGGGYGDWLSVGEVTDTPAMNTAFIAYTARLMEKISAVLGYKEKEKYYKKMFEGFKTAFNETFVKEDGRIANDTQCIYVMALHFDLLSEKNRKLAIEHLVENIDNKGGHLATGFVGVGYLLPELTEGGRNDVAYKLITNKTYPSWGYSIVNGATTIWERWNSYTKETGFGDVGMNSFNHYSLGSCGEWMFRYCAGIEADEMSPGYHQFTIKPYPDKTFSYASAKYTSILGDIESGWSTKDDKFTQNVTIPANAKALVYVPATRNDVIYESGMQASKSVGVKHKGYSGDYAVFEVTSGKYSFTVEKA